MREFWVSVRPWDKELAKAALESGATALFLEKGKAAEAKALARVNIVSPDGDIILGRDALEIKISSKADEIAAASSKAKYLILATSDWTVIPLENLIANASSKLIAKVSSSKDAKLALGVLERGVDGILLEAKEPSLVREVSKLFQKSNDVPLSIAKVTNIEPLSMGDRACIDTCTNMKQGQGMLVGNTSSAFFLVHSESIENPYVEQRPFRVNAGPVHAYALLPGNKTKYLSELKAGTEVLAIDSKGMAEAVVVGRVKIEKRPLVLVEAELDGKTISIILQNAETIRLTGKDGSALSVASLKKGDEVLVHTEESGRHFGTKVKETITER